MAIIRLRGGEAAIVDEQDVPKLSPFRWRFAAGYVYCYARGKKIYLHRLLFDEPPGVLIDHRDGNTLDNRRSNLRVASKALNNVNKDTARPTGYRGVEVTRSGRRFRARISGNSEHLGSFATAEAAARAYDEAALKRWGDFARLNFPRAQGD